VAKSRNIIVTRVPGEERDLRVQLRPGRSYDARGWCCQRGEIDGPPAVHLGDRVGVVAQGGGPAAAVAEAGGGVAQVDACGLAVALSDRSLAVRCDHARPGTVTRPTFRPTEETH